MTPDQIEQARQRLREAVRNIWRWQPDGYHDCTMPEPPSETHRGGREACIKRGRCDVNEARDAALDALVRFEVAVERTNHEAYDDWCVTCANETCDARAELARLVEEAL